MIVVPKKPAVSLLSKEHDRSRFSCGVESLDLYLKQRATQDMRRNLAACFVLHEEESHDIFGYYTLSAYGIDPGALPEQLHRKLPAYPIIPATLLGRLAVDQQHSGRGFGELLVADAIRRAVRQKQEIASYALVVEALNPAARAFYRHMNFISFPREENRLFIPLASVCQFSFPTIASGS